MQFPRISRRSWLIAALLVVFLIGGCLSLHWFAMRHMLRLEASYYADRARLHEEAEREFRVEIARFRQGSDDTNRVFELLRWSFLGNNSKEVAFWEDAPNSPERTAVALKWAEFAAEEAKFEAAVDRLIAKDYEEGRMPHHISGLEVVPPKKPAGWTEEDYKH